MGFYLKIAGVWTAPDKVYVKKSGVWTLAQTVQYKDAGVWNEVFSYDTTPPEIPMVTLELVETSYWEDKKKKSGRHIKIGLKTPSGGHDSDVKRWRLLTTHQDKRPTTQYGGRFIDNPDDNFPDEPWSEFYFNGYLGSDTTRQTDEWQYKTFPRSAKNNSQVGGQKFHYFSVWAEDFNGNWSAVNHAEIWVPKRNVDAAERIVREARFQTVETGSWTSAGFVSGQLQQSKSPFSEGLFLYNNQITSKIGGQGAPSVRKAQIYIQRTNDDGRAEANITLYTHAYPNAAGLPAVGSFTRANKLFLGTLGKGEGRWFDLPASYLTALENDQIKGFGIDNQKPGSSAGAKDFSVVKSRDQHIRCGELHVTWIEEP